MKPPLPAPTQSLVPAPPPSSDSSDSTDFSAELAPPALACPDRKLSDRRTEESLDSTDLSAELAPPALDYLTQIDIHHILGNLFHALASGRVSPQRASALAYICSVLVQSQKGVHDQVRFMELTGFKFLKSALEARYPKPKRQTQPAKPSSSSPSSSSSFSTAKHSAPSPTPAAPTKS